MSATAVATIDEQKESNDVTTENTEPTPNPVEMFWRQFTFQGGEILVPTSTVHYPWRRSYSGAWRCEGTEHSDHLGYDDDFARDRLTGGTYLLFRLGKQITPPES